MNTPVWDFIERYRESGAVRLHMPGHKGRILTGPEAEDITEIAGADELFCPRGILRESEENAARLFGTGRTLYSAEGSSLCIRAMLYLARLRAAEVGRPFRVLAGRNAHKTLISAAALLGLEIEWLRPRKEEGLLSCRPAPADIAAKLDKDAYMAVYLTAPDYCGGMADVAGAAKACRERGVPLLVDNAHGAYLKFLEEDRHPMTLGADLCCDSAHKTLPCLTGGAYLHIAAGAEDFAAGAEQAMALFASTSPSYLILRSLDRVNALLAGDYPARLRKAAARTAAERRQWEARGWRTAGTEPMKLVIRAKSGGYTGTELGNLLREHGIECEFAGPDLVTLMPSAETSEEDWEALSRAREAIALRDPLPEQPPAPPESRPAMGIRDALMSPREEVPVGHAEGRILADAYMGCPPAVPVLVAGETVTREAILCLRYYGITTCMVVKEPAREGAGAR